jgi:hypothetical protein
MVATEQDVGIFLRALNDGSFLSDEEQRIYSSIYEYDIRVYCRATRVLHAIIRI